jgi:hypothetical protein
LGSRFGEWQVSWLGQIQAVLSSDAGDCRA